MNAFDLTTFFLKQKEFFQQLWQSAWFRNARQVPFIHQLVIANTFQALVREELVKWPVFRGQKFSAVYTFFIRTYVYESSFFSLDQKYRSKAKSSLHSFSVKPTYLSQMLPSLLPSRRLRINWSWKGWQMKSTKNGDGNALAVKGSSSIIK